MTLQHRYATHLPPFPYFGVLDQIHQHLLPRTYVEIGVQLGCSLTLALPGTIAVGVDPEPLVETPLLKSTRVFAMTSDAFFEQVDVHDLLGHQPLDLAFIDGMHHFEFALRDFINLERFSHHDTTILVHDCYPMNEITAQRDRSTGPWSGDIWRLVVCLKELRPDLAVSVVDVGPTGLGVIGGLDPSSTVLAARYDEIVERFLSVPFSYLTEVGQPQALNRVPNEWNQIRDLLPDRPFRSDRLARLQAERLARQLAFETRRGLRHRARKVMGRPAHPAPPRPAAGYPSGPGAGIS